MQRQNSLRINPQQSRLVRSMLKRRITQLSLLIAVSTGALLVGVFMPELNWKNSGNSHNSIESQQGSHSELDVTTLVSMSPEQRATMLETATHKGKSLNRARARYLLASDRLENGEAEQAIALLKNLERDYPQLAPYVALKRARAYENIPEKEGAKRAWEDLLKRYGDNPVAAEALYALGKNNPEYWNRALVQFPAHPRSMEIAQQRLQQNPNQPRLLLAIAKYGFHLPKYVSVLDTLRTRYASTLTPEDWETVAFGYWEKLEYGKGGIAYGKAAKTSQNLYRHARGLWLGGKTREAREAYKKLIEQFPNAGEDTALGLIRLARLSKDEEALTYYDRVIYNFPSHAAEAMLDKSKILDRLGSAKSASQLRQWLLDEYNDSETAAKLRWELAEKAAKANNLSVAWKWAQEITAENPESAIAAQAGFWVGKWAEQLGRVEDAKTAFEYMVLRYPHSYYAWRSAVLLGWDVGDFTTVRSKSPEVVHPVGRESLPAGSETLNELYQLGEDRDAWELWQLEFVNRRNPSVAEQYTDGVLRIGVGDNLDGMWMLSSLSRREKPEEKAEYLRLKQGRTYWQALYPFPYLETIVKWSRDRKLNTVLVTALIRQESRFMPNIKSVVGATGLMQVMPETGKESAEKIDLVSYDLENVNDNVNIGTFYLDFTHQKYDNNSMLAVASYNAGPYAVENWLERFGFDDADAFVEKIPYPETRGYVESVFENYWNYLQIYNPEVAQMMADHYEKHR